MQTDEAKEKIKEIVGEKPKKPLCIADAKERLRRCDPGIDISKILYYLNQNDPVQLKKAIIQELISQESIKYLTDPIIQMIQNELSDSLSEYIAKKC